MGEASPANITISNSYKRATRPPQPPTHIHSVYAKTKALVVNMNAIVPIPVELIQRILVFCHACDVAAFAQACRLAHSVVYHSSDQYLWRELFLFHPFDDPRKSLQAISVSRPAPFFDWQHELTRRLKARRSLTSAHASAHEKACALETLISVMQKTPAVSQGGIAQSHDIAWLNQILRRSRVLDFPSNVDTSPHHAMVYSQLRSYVALSLDDQGDAQTKRRRNASRRSVYDLRYYNSNNSWGPYLDNGTVNWAHIERLINVILSNLRDLPDPWKNMRPPLGLEATRPYSAPGTCVSSTDWAGVEGKSGLPGRL